MKIRLPRVVAREVRDHADTLQRIEAFKAWGAALVDAMNGDTFDAARARLDARDATRETHAVCGLAAALEHVGDPAIGDDLSPRTKASARRILDTLPRWAR